MKRSKPGWVPLRPLVRHGFAAAVVLWAFLANPCGTRGGDLVRSANLTGRVARYTSGRLELRTDLPAAAAEARLRRLESALASAARYWRRPCDRRIICFVVDDLAAWPEDAFPNSKGRFVLKYVRGGMEVLTGEEERSPEAHVYAMSEPGIAEHELVHAYCLLAFGTCGPDWYKEGMAEMAYHGSAGERAVRCSRSVARLLRTGRTTSIREILEAGPFTQPIAARIDALATPIAGSENDPSRWLATDDAMVQRTRQSYHKSWALCHFLANNPNYQERFRQLGIGYLSRTGVTFDQIFGPVERRLAFEFDLFLRDIEDGYRIDLCHWDWDNDFTRLCEGESKAVRVLAARGYQPAGIVVSKTHRYAYRADGQWTTCHRHVETTADGSYFGRGSLEGVVFHDGVLGMPFELGSSGSFVAEETGKLYLRCRDDWQRLADNSGSVEVRLTLSSN